MCFSLLFFHLVKSWPIFDTRAGYIAGEGDKRFSMAVSNQTTTPTMHTAIVITKSITCKYYYRFVVHENSSKMFHYVIMAVVQQFYRRPFHSERWKPFRRTRSCRSI